MRPARILVVEDEMIIARELAAQLGFVALVESGRKNLPFQPGDQTERL